ncbi:hypothetical protein SGFS_007950 [Streptomyces graminofaciens]|uniref:Uncharacterized protein n=1 Tax=Streptomyces graminofaciens TaxID=68212 RepID=A0ABN5V8A0_9ACTN|nr:hypothetical protein SGFS_007950 [Streptomyces graminofaciens]
MDVLSPVLAPQALRAADAPTAEIPARRPRLLMLSPDIQNLLAPKGDVKERKSSDEEHREGMNVTRFRAAALTHGPQPFRGGVRAVR